MKFPRTYTLKEVADIINARFVGDENFPISGFNEIHRVEVGDIVFVDHPKYYEKALESKASVILINKQVVCPKGKALLISDDPFRDFNKISKMVKPFRRGHAVISDTAKIGRDTILQPNVFIGDDVKIGSNCLIHSNVVIYDSSEIGDNVIIHAGTVIGADAFYYKNRKTHHDKLYSCGNVLIKNNVHIGALCTLDRGVAGSTIIGEGTKIDNQVHIGHDSIIGKHCILASQVGIAGCCILEDRVTFWGQVGMANSLTVGENATILAQSGISKSLPGNATYFGYPAEESSKKFKEIAVIRKIIKEDT